MSMRKTIFTALGPNYQRDDIVRAARLLFQPWRWLYGPAPGQLEQQFKHFFSAYGAHSFATGRGALWALLTAMRIQPGDEVLLQAYTCVAVAEPIIWHDAQPVYVDIDRTTATMSVADLEKKITTRSKILIIQHTFGLPAGIDELLAVARKHRLLVIEDCAHALGARYHNTLVGTFGHAALFSFGRDKVISSVFGGMAIAHDQTVAEALQQVHESCLAPSAWWTVQQLLHPLVIQVVKKTYDFFGLGKIVLTLSQRINLISKAVYPEERRGGRPLFITKKLPNALAVLALQQFKKCEAFNHHRQMVAREYSSLLRTADIEQRGVVLPEVYHDREHIFLRYLLVSDRAAEIIVSARRFGIILGDWYTTPIAPCDVDLAAIGYQQGSCPNAEWLAERTVNLPTHQGITRADIESIIRVVLAA
jgi:dTDP-4-amino-4,6-dideoxygalactose transaminase